MRMKFPTFVEATDANRVDGFLERGGALVPLTLKFDPHDVRAGDPSSGSLGGLSESDAAMVAKIDSIQAFVGPAEAVRKQIATVDAVHDRVALIDALVANESLMAARAERVERARISTLRFDGVAERLRAVRESVVEAYPSKEESE